MLQKFVKMLTTNIMIPDSIIKIHKGCFLKCSSLINIIFSNNITKNPDSFFRDDQ